MPEGNGNYWLNGTQSIYQWAINGVQRAWMGFHSWSPNFRWYIAPDKDKQAESVMVYDGSLDWHKPMKENGKRLATYVGMGCESAANYPSLQAAIDASSYGAAVYVPPGQHVLSSKLVADNRPLVLRGVPGLSEIVWDTNDPAKIGMDITGNNHNEQVHISDLMLKTTAAAQGTAITVDRSGEIVNGVIRDRISRRVSIENVEVSGATGPTHDGFFKGIVFDDVHNSRISHYHFKGMNNGAPVDVLSDAALEVLGDGIPTELLIENMVAYFAKYGIRAYGKLEGLEIDKPKLIAVRTGIDWEAPDGRPAVQVMGGHISAFKYGLRAVGADQIVAHGTRYYHRPDAAEDGTAIHLDNCLFGTITGNIFTDTSQRNFTHVAGRNGTMGILAQSNVNQNGEVSYDFDATCHSNKLIDNLSGPMMGV